MNKTRRPLDNQTRKKQAKEVKKGQKILSEPQELSRTDTLTVAKALKKYPAKTKKALVESLVKNMEIKKTKAKAKQSKRTTPSELDLHESPRASSHIEGQRWEKTLVKQSVGKGKALTSKIVKRATKAPVKRKK